MASAALEEWRTQRMDRIEQLYDAHSRVEGGDSRGRRWRTGQINRLLIIALVAEFQGFARDLHDLSADEFVDRSQFFGYGQDLSLVLRNLLTTDRNLDKGNPGIQALAEDFGRFGLDWWPTLKARHALTLTRQSQLDRLIRARNGIAHADAQKIDELDDEGYPMTLETVTRWRSSVSALTDTMDRVMSEHVVAVHGGPEPW